MPNHTYCSLKFHYHNDKGEMIQEIQKTLKGKNGKIDFSRIIPPPENIFNGDLGREEKEICNREGRPTWYDWNSENWGTKWNAYGIKLISKDNWKLVYLFQTAWNDPTPVIDKIFTMFDKQVEIQFMCADDGGFFAKHRWKNEEGEGQNIWNTSNNNDAEGIIRYAIFQSLNTEY